MFRSSLVVFVASALALSVSSFVAHGDPVTPQAISGQAVESPDSRNEGEEAVSSAVAAAVLGAAATEFGENDIAVKLDRVEINPASLRDRAVSGEGRLQLSDDAEWISFEFEVLYDTVTTLVTYPRLKLTGLDINSAMLANNSQLASSLTAMARQRMRTEFADQPVRLTLERVTRHSDASRYVRVEGSGLAKFGDEGNAPAQVSGLYDTLAERWVHVHYELGGSALGFDSKGLASR